MSAKAVHSKPKPIETLPVTELLKPSDGRNLESECSTIGTVLHFPDAYAHVANDLRPEDFVASLSALTWRAMAALNAEGKQITLTNVAVEVFKRGDLVEKLGVIDEQDLAELIAREYMGAEINAKNLPTYASQVLDRAVRRRIGRDLVAGANRLAGEKRTLTREYIREQLGELLFQTVGEATVRGTRHVAVIAEEYVKSILEPGETPQFIPTGLESFNKHLNGDYLGKLTVHFGYQGQGKTSLLLSNAYYDLTVHHTPVAIFTMEQDTSEVISKFFFKMTGLRKKLMGAEPLTDQDKFSIQTAKQTIAAWPLRICSDYRRMTVPQLRSVLQEYAMLDGFSPRKIYFDGLWRADASPEERKQYPVVTTDRSAELGLISEKLIGVAEEFGASIWATHQLNRVGGKTENERIDRNDMSYATQVINNAHRIFAMHRPEQEFNLTEFYCIKDRITGQANRFQVTLDYDFDMDLFTEMGGSHVF